MSTFGTINLIYLFQRMLIVSPAKLETNSTRPVCDARSFLSLQIEDALEGLPGFKSVSVMDFRSVSLLGCVPTSGQNICPHNLTTAQLVSINTISLSSFFFFFFFLHRPQKDTQGWVISLGCGSLTLNHSPQPALHLSPQILYQPLLS